MEDLKLSEITNTFGKYVVENHEDAIDFGLKELDWNQDEILEGIESINLEINGAIEKVELNCLYVDSGSEDVYFLKW